MAAGDQEAWIEVVGETFPERCAPKSMQDSLGLLLRRPGVGVGVTAVVYSLFTAEREQELAGQIEDRLVQLRGGLPTAWLENEPDFEQAARSVAAGRETPEAAFKAALTRTQLGSKLGRRIEGELLDLPWEPLTFALPARLAQRDELTNGVIVTHYREPGAD